MKKNPFLRPLTLYFLLLSPLAKADEVVDVAVLQAERARLIDIVIDLEGSFADTLKHYQSLQNDFVILKVESGNKVAPAEVEKLRAELAKQAALLQENQVKNAANPAEKKEMERTLGLLRMDLGNLRRELHRERANIEELSDQSHVLKEIKMQREALDKELANSIGNEEVLKEKIAELGAQLEKANQDLAASAKALQGESEERKKVGGKLAQAGQDMDAQRQKAQVELAELQQKFETEKTALLDEQKRMGRVGELEKELKAMSARGDIWAKEEQKLQATITELKQEKEALAKRFEGMDALSESDKKARVEAEGKVGELEKSHQEAMAAAVKNQETLATEIAQQKEAMQSANERLSKMEEMQGQMANLEKQAQEFQKKIQELENNKTQIDTKMQKLQSEISTKDAALRTAMAGAADVQNLRSEIAKKDEELKKVRKELGEMMLKSEVASKQLIGLKMRVAEIKPVTYAMGAADVKGQQMRVLSDMKECLAMFPQARFEIVGHTCDLGSSEDNQVLSTERADSLRKFLIENGINAEVVKAHGEGETNPLVPNTDEDSRKQNRRVEIHILD